MAHLKSSQPFLDLFHGQKTEYMEAMKIEIEYAPEN